MNSLGTETGPTGEIEIVKYIDSLLYDDPIGSDNEFQLPYRRGTIMMHLIYFHKTHLVLEKVIPMI